MKKPLLFSFALLQLVSLKTFASAMAYESTTFNFRFSSASANEMTYGYDDIQSGGLLSFSAPTVQIQQYSSYSGDALAATDTTGYSGDPMYFSSSVQATATAGDEGGVADAYIEKTSKIILKNTSNFTFDQINFFGHYSTAWPGGQLIPYEGNMSLDTFQWLAMTDDHNYGGSSYEGFLQYPGESKYGTGCNTDHPELASPTAHNVWIEGDGIACGDHSEAAVHDRSFSLLNIAPGQEYTFTFFQSAHAKAYNVPEPAPLALLTIGFAGFALLRRRKYH